MNTSRDKLILAAVDQIGVNGWAKASTKSIAAAAEVNELTLFRLFRTKKGLLEAVLEATIGTMNVKLESMQRSTLEKDLELLAITYSNLLDNHARFVAQILSEASKPELQSIVKPYQQRLFDSIRLLFRRYPESLDASRTDQLIVAFMGPLLTASLFSHLDVQTTITPQEHVKTFLDGQRL